MSRFNSKWILRILIIVGLVFLVYSILFYSKIGPGDEVPPFKITSLSGETLDSAELSSKSKAYLLHFWANWCSVCIPELDELNRLKKQFGEDLIIAAIHDGKSSRDEEIVKMLVDRKNLEFSVYLDGGEVVNLFGVRMVPESFLVGQNGVIIEKLVGAVKWTDPANVDLIKKVIGGELR